MTLARQTYSPTVVFPIPSDCAIQRSVISSPLPQPRTSRTLRIDNLSADIRIPCVLFAGAGSTDSMPRQPALTPPHRCPPQSNYYPPHFKLVAGYVGIRTLAILVFLLIARLNG